jgi:hypothetical protein
VRAVGRKVEVSASERRVRALGRRLGFLAVAIGIAAMTACGGTVQERLGLSRRSPDEFQVVRRQPLVVPPDYRLPAPGTASPAQQQDMASRDARSALFGGIPNVRQAAPSDGERALLAAVPGTIEPNIRDIILTENSELTQLDESRFLFILDFQRRAMTEGTGLDTPLDATAEAARLEAAGASARVITRRVDSSVVQ